nr:MAG TPA: hypothetical protein [Caudoviricetes sp.]
MDLESKCYLENCIACVLGAYLVLLYWFSNTFIFQREKLELCLISP